MPPAMKANLQFDTAKLDKALKKLDKAVGKRTLDETVTEGSYIVQRRAVQIIREKGIIDLGELLGSVQNVDESIQVEKASSKLVIKRIGTNVEHGLYNEFGTIYMAARPWLRPAWDESVDRAQRAMLLYLRRKLEGMF